MYIENKEIDNKIKSLADLVSIIQQEKIQGQRVVLCHGVFDGGIHPGHIQYLSDARKQGDILVVTVTPDQFVDRGPNRPLLRHELRAESIAAIGFVDYVAINDHPTVSNTIRALKPNVYAKGSEFKDLKDPSGKIQLEVEAIESVGGRMYFTQGIVMSSSGLLNQRGDNTLSQEAREFLSDFRTKYSGQLIVDHIAGLSNLKILVVGETIIDEYQFSQGLDRSPKEQLITYQLLDTKKYLGGAAEVANNVGAFVDSVRFLTVLGGESHADNEFAKAHFAKNLNPTIFYAGDRGTIIKRRVVDPISYRKYFSQVILNDAPLPPALEGEVDEFLRKRLPDYDLVMVADYGHGFLTPKVVQTLCSTAPYLAINVQTNSANRGFNLVTKYPKANLICIDHEEARLAMSERFGELEEVVDKLSLRGKYDQIVVTRGHMGSLAYRNHTFVKIPALSDRVVDKMGAGDAFFSYLAPLACKDYPLELSSFVGNIAGALAVNVVGNEPLKSGTVNKYIISLLK